MRVLFINSDGSGFADHIEIPGNLTIEELFQQRLPDGKPEDFLIRVNRLPVCRGQVLEEGDRVSVTPSKIEGAAV